MRSLPEGLTTEMLRHLTIKHINRYYDMLESFAEHINRSECSYLLRTWKSIELRKGSLDPGQYAEHELNEIYDAYLDETE